MRPGDALDPILLQVLPQPAEQAEHPGFSTDPVGERRATRRPGLLWKYQGRILMVATGACGVHCRFCFRRHFPYSKGAAGAGRWDSLTRHLAADTSIREVILSGGDPLTLNDDRLARVLTRLDSIAHLRRVRFHTRLPVVIPQRITEEFLHLTRQTRLTTIVVVHLNHPNELDASVAEALGRLIDAGVPVLSQSVLLRGINDRADVLAELYQRLVDLRVMPYYLHQLDRVAGAAHFEVPEARGIALVEELRRRLPGYAVPRYVREIPGRPNKVVLA